MIRELILKWIFKSDVLIKLFSENVDIRESIKVLFEKEIKREIDKKISSKQVLEVRDIESIIDQKLFSAVFKEVERQNGKIENRINSEEFLDSIIKRIKDKQL